MKRRYLKIGDKSSVGGTVVEGIPLMSHRGTDLTFVGASVTCPVCKSTGQIIAKGPRWPGNLMGKQAALEGDVCSCKCYPMPVMVASQTDMTMSFESHQLAAMGFTSIGTSLSDSPASANWIKFALTEPGNCEGLGCRAFFADGSTATGTFDASNEVHFNRPNASPCEKVELLTSSHPPSESVISRLLSSMAG